MFKPFVLIPVFLLLTSSMTLHASASHTLPDGQTLQDPTRPANWQILRQSAKPAVAFQLNYILTSDQRQQAIINGQKVSEGDWISGAKVLRITADSVTLSVDGHQRVLQVQARKSIKK